MLQVLYVKTIHNRYVRHATSQLVDLMSLTNISAFILTDKFAGYYIHGQSNLPHADTDLEVPIPTLPHPNPAPRRHRHTG